MAGVGSAMVLNLKKIYTHRFNRTEHAQRVRLWKILCAYYFQKLISKDDTVVDVAAGRCEFINAIKCKRKIAVDLNVETKKYADKSVEVLKIDALKLTSKLGGKVNVVFMSNFLEHLGTKRDVLTLFNQVNKILVSSGRVIILQPNINLAKEKYWDFIDHHIALNDKSVVEALEVSGFEMERSIVRFLPYSTKSIFPISPVLVKIYLLLPAFLRPFAGQSLFVARKVTNE